MRPARFFLAVLLGAGVLIGYGSAFCGAPWAGHCHHAAATASP
jgi:hypothetical protein